MTSLSIYGHADSLVSGIAGIAKILSPNDVHAAPALRPLASSPLLNAGTETSLFKQALCTTAEQSLPLSEWTDPAHQSTAPTAAPSLCRCRSEARFAAVGSRGLRVAKAREPEIKHL